MPREPQNALDQLLRAAEPKLDQLLKDLDSRFFGEETPGRRRLTPKEEDHLVWSVLEGRRPVSPAEEQTAWDILRSNFREAEMARQREG